MEFEENTRQRQARERKAQLRAEALRLFSTQGVEATSMKDLAQAAGVTPGLLYHYFASKELLVADVLAQYTFVPHLHRIIEHADDKTVAVVLGEVGEGFVAVLGERAPFARMLVRESLVHPAVAAQLSAMIDEGIAVLTRFLDKRIATGELRSHDSSVTARSLMFTLFMKRLLFDSLGAAAGAFAQELVAILLEGIAVVPGKDE